MYPIRYLHQWLRETHLPDIQLQMMEGFEPSILWKSTSGDLLPPPLETQVLAHPVERYVLQVPQGNLCGEFGFILTPDNCLLKDPHILRAVEGVKNLANAESAKLQNGTLKVRYLEGNVATIASDWSTCYFHWILEILPRLKLLQAANVSYDTLVTGPLSQAFQFESLARLGVDLTKVVTCEEDVLIKTYHLIAPSFVRRTIEPDILVWLKTLFPTQIRPQRRVYISRATVRTRHVANEEDLYPVLDKFGFEVIQLELMTLQQQSELMANTAVLMGSCGSGFTNMIFCSRKTHVIEFFNPIFDFPYFRQMAAERGMPYSRLVGSMSSDIVEDPTIPPHLANVEIPPHDLAKLLQQLPTSI